MRNLFAALVLFLSGAAAAEPVSPLVELRRALHRHPELANRETKTMELLAGHLRALGLEVRTGVAKTGLTALVKGGRPGPTVALRAPMDAFPVQEKSSATYKSEVAGVSHACGHDAVMAAVVGAAETLHARRSSLAGSVLLVFQPAEEGAPDGEEGGAPLLVKEKALAGVSAVLTFHPDETIAAGQAGLHESTVYAGADTIEILVQGAGAHGATPWKGVDAVVVAAQVVSGLQLVASRQTDIWSPVVVTIGTVAGGTRPNAIPGEVKLAGTLRSYTAEGRSRAQESIRRVAEHTAEAFGAKAAVVFKDGIPPVVNHARLVKALRPVLESDVGAANMRPVKPLPFADDFSVISEKIPSFYFQLGVGRAHGKSPGTHTERYDLDEAAIPLAARLLDSLAVAALALGPSK